MDISSGIPTIRDYLKLTESDCFLKLEHFSNQFIQKYKNLFLDYRKKWVIDSFHQWSRQWEYPYVYEQINRWVSLNQNPAPVILDAGCGLTFFPSFLSTTYPQSTITCSDFDAQLSKPFAQISAEYPHISFTAQDLRSIFFKEESYDIIYCISVLEHTKDYPQILREFKRLLKPKGILILTFDISLNQCSDIPVKEADELIDLVDQIFPGISNPKTNSLQLQINHADILTTHYFQKENPNLLPWKHPRLSLIKSALQRKCWPIGTMKHLTVYCKTALRNN